MTTNTSKPPVANYVLAPEPKTSFSGLSRSSKKFLGKAGLTLFAVTMLTTFLLPMLFMTLSSLKTEDQMSNGAILPKSHAVTTVDGEELDLYVVPLPDGSMEPLGLVTPGRQSSVFFDPATGKEIVWEGRWRTLQPLLETDPSVGNFEEAWSRLDFLRLLRNTGVIAGLGMAGTIISSTLVAYGLSRFRMPFKGLILASLVATIILPRFVTLVPTYAIFSEIGWVGTWLPLIVPHFFANAYNVFLLRQFFLTIPRDIDEAAEIDGAGPFRILVTIILPQAKGAILAVSLFHLLYAWNDFLEPLVYLSGNRGLQPISVGLYEFLGLYDTAIPLVQAGAILSMLVPVGIFLALQKVFLGGIDLSGSVK